MRFGTSLTPRDARLLVRYFDSVDDVVTARLTSGFSPHEDHLCEMMDENLSSLSSLSYPLSTLKADLAADKRPLRAALQIEAKKYPPHVERQNSSDLGIIVDYRDQFDHQASFQKAALFQAKKLYAKNKQSGESYNVASSFDELDPDQLQRMMNTARSGSFDRDQLHPNWSDGNLFHYLFYCPRVESYDERSQFELWHYVIPAGRHQSRRHHFWFHDGPFGLAEAHHLQDYASDPQRHFPGLLVSETSWLEEFYFGAEGKQQPSAPRRPKPRVTGRDIYQRFWGETDSLSWFLVYGMLLGRRGCSSPRALALARGNADGVQLEAPLLLPRYVLTLRVEVGTPSG